MWSNCLLWILRSGDALPCLSAAAVCTHAVQAFGRCVSGLGTPGADGVVCHLLSTNIFAVVGQTKKNADGFGSHCFHPPPNPKSKPPHNHRQGHHNTTTTAPQHHHRTTTAPHHHNHNYNTTIHHKTTAPPLILPKAGFRSCQSTRFRGSEVTRYIGLPDYLDDLTNRLPCRVMKGWSFVHFQVCLEML